MFSLLRHITKSALFGLIAAGSLATAAMAEERDYQEAIYAFLVARHCELATAEVEAGFRLTLLHLLERDGLAAEAARAARSAAGEVVRIEWRNRGHGPRDPRCLKEGRAAAQRFRDFLFFEEDG